MKPQLTVRAQMLIACALFSCIVVLLGGLNWLTVQSLGGSLQQAVNGTASKANHASSMQTLFQEMRAEARATQISIVIGYYQSRLTPKAAAENTCNGCHSIERIGEERQRVEALSRRVQDHVQKLSATNLTGEERAASGAIRQSMQAWLAAYSEYLQYTQSNKFDEAHTLATEKVLPAMQQAGDNAAKLAAGQQKALDAAALASQAEIVRSRTITAVFVAISLAMVIGMAILLNRLSSRLKESVEEIGGGVNAFRQVSRQISSSSQSLAQNANSQAASLTQSAAAAEQARRSSSVGLDRLHSTTEAGRKVSLRVRETAERLQDMLKAMNDMSARAGKVVSILKTIDEIAFQTNILALNAAVEAARAGQAGLGFAVVAEEVRNLAQRCARASQETGALINASATATREGTERLDRLAAGVTGIETELTRMLALVEQAQQGGEEESRAIAEMATAMDHMQRDTQKTAAAAEQSAAAAEELNSQANVMNDTATRIRVLFAG